MTSFSTIESDAKSLATKATDDDVQALAKLVEHLAHHCFELEKVAKRAELTARQALSK